jgi:dihydroorotate dehydrogenase
VIISNTTLQRPNLKSHHRLETGGLSGKPLHALSTRKLAQFYQATNGSIPLIGVGGIHDAESAFKKILAGARLIQAYSGLVYKGPALVSDVLNGLPQLMRARGLKSIAEASGADAARLATTPASADSA